MSVSSSGNTGEDPQERSKSTLNSKSSTKHHSRFSTTSDTYAHEVYQDLLDDSKIHDFLDSSGSYDSKSEKWNLSQDTTTEGLIRSVSKVVRSIMERFVKSARPEVKRTLVNMHNAKGNEEKNEDGYKHCPTLVVRATGPSFEDPAPAPSSSSKARCSVAFSNVASYLSVKPDSEARSEKEDAQEMETYAREIFAMQPNRIYVRSIVVTRKHVRFIHFDRAGTQVTPLLDIHQHPATFVRLIAGLASVDERILGLDDSIQWTIVNGRKASGTLTTTGPTGEVKKYPIIEHIPIPRETIRGRGTTCWRVRDPDTHEELVVKDSWRPDDRPPEYEFLEIVKGISGVVEMVSYEAGRWETKDFRCASTAGQYQNRVSMRVTMKSYGKPVEFFSSVLQLLYAFRDAIAGHQRLVSEDVGIIHRDISHNNILLGAEGALEGDRGILIDFDMAFRATADQPTVAADPNVGTRIFQSLSVLSSSNPQGRAPVHDYLDDLESFFLVLAYIFLFRKPDGSFFPSNSEGPSIVRRWEDPDPDTAYDNKDAIFGGSADSLDAVRLIEETWGPVCLKLFKNFRAWASDMGEEKERLLRDARESDSFNEEDDDEEDEEEEGGDERDRTSPDPLESLHSQRDEHYSQVLGFFDEAINALESFPTETTPVDHPLPPSAEETEPPVVPPPVEEPLPTTPRSEAAALPSPASSSIPDVPTPALTPPPSTPPKFSVYANPSSPGLKRRSEEDPHPESPSAKVRRVKERDLISLKLDANASNAPRFSADFTRADACKRVSAMPGYATFPVELALMLGQRNGHRMCRASSLSPGHVAGMVLLFQVLDAKKEANNATTGRVAIACLHNGRYLSRSPVHERVVTAPTPYYWDLVGEGTSRYSLRIPLDTRRLTLPTPPGECTVSSPAQVEEATIKFILLEVTPGNREAFLSGLIGPYAYPGAPAYYTFGSANEIRIYNHLDKTLYAAVSGQGSSSQYQIDPGSYNYWLRTSNERVHLTTGISDTGEQSVQVFEARTGMRLHVYSLGDAASWRGMSLYLTPNLKLKPRRILYSIIFVLGPIGVPSVTIEDAEYEANWAEKPKHIGIKNDLEFDIYISVFSTVKNGNTKQYSLIPGSTDFWPRNCLETVFVSVGSAPGLPQSYVGRPGYILHINDWKAVEARGPNERRA
ncbi:hypothetical protein NMY22_g8894 [Coprinellus aureogranulatus]|nr:hypothetical protein NMY22_g8894 [Coprinellus aureogranulatus]